MKAEAQRERGISRCRATGFDDGGRAASQGMQFWKLKRQRNRFLPGASGRNASPANTLIFTP